MRNNISKT